MGNFFPMRASVHEKNGLLNLLEYTNRTDLVMIEIGSYTGESAEIFLSSGRVRKLYCIDPWMNGYDDTDQASFQESMILVENKFDERTVRFGEKVIKLKKTSTDALGYFLSQNLKVDLVYVDGNHKAEHVREDLSNYLSILNPGGFMSGHDWQAPWIRDTILDVLGREPDSTFQDNSWIYKIGK